MEYTFVDSKGTKWSLAFNLGMMRYLDKCDFSTVTTIKPWSFLSVDKNWLNEILTNDGFLFAVIWAMVQGQAKELHAQGLFPHNPQTEKELAEEAFVSLVDGSTIIGGREAFWEGLCDFFRGNQTVLSSIKKNLDKNRKILEEKLVKATEKAAETLARTMDTEIDKQLKNLDNQSLVGLGPLSGQ